MLVTHVAIRPESSIVGTRDRPQVGILAEMDASHPPTPWGRIAVGERVYLQWDGGPVIATAVVRDVRHFQHCDAATLRTATSGFPLHDVASFWRSLPPCYFAVVVYLEDEHWLAEPITPAGPSYGERC